jgi:hypothetical protein
MNETIEGSVIHVPQAPARRASVPEVLPSDQNPMAMIARAVAQGWEPERLKQLMDLNDRYEAEQARKAFNEAFAAFKAEIINVIKNRTVDAGPLTGKKYAELFSVVNAVTPSLSRNGLSASWKLTKDEKDWIEVTCTIKHAKGHSESVSMGGPPDAGGAKSAIQARASTVSYLERYTLKAVCGVAEQGDDDNGTGAGSGSGKSEVEPDPEGKKALEACGSMRKLTETWNALSKEKRATLAGVMNECRAKIKAADTE